MNLPKSKRGDIMGKPQTAAKNKWNAKTYDQLRVNVKKGERDKIKAHAESLGLSLNAYINKLIEEDMNKTQDSTPNSL